MEIVTKKVVVEIIGHKELSALSGNSTFLLWSLLHRWNTGKACLEMNFWVLVYLGKFVVDFTVVACVFKPSEGWPLGFATVPVIACMEEYGKGTS